MIDFIWDIFQQSQISRLNESLRTKALHDSYQDSKISMSGHDIRELTQRHEQLKLVTMAMWTLLKEHCGLTESDLRKYIEQVDMMDGKLDGRINTKEQCKCSGCQRTLLTTALACPYCGIRLKRKSVFANS